MANPKRNASGMGKALLQSDRNATLLIDVLRFYGKEGKFQLHDFVVMPNHLHLLITGHLFAPPAFHRPVQYLFQTENLNLNISAC
ncbi:MAG: hypothetical protein WCD57_06400 [Acidobacteriaceae bacterium]